MVTGVQTCALPIAHSAALCPLPERRQPGTGPGQAAVRAGAGTYGQGRRPLGRAIVFSLTNLAALIINKAANQDGSNFDLAGILSSHLEAGLKLITTCNPDDYARLIAHTDLAAAMDKIEISHDHTVVLYL